MTIDGRRVAESAAEAALLLAVSALPVAWRSLDTSLTAVLGGMLALLTAGVYALHAVTFDCLRMTAHRHKHRFSLTQREE
jgi:F0F1-type ATP synthase assembly protein I